MTAPKTIAGRRIEHGFRAGAATVEYHAADEKTGAVYIGLHTPKHSFEIRVTKTGKVRIFSKGMEVLHG